jgi:LPXTG-motif cell wall-anchored protein
MPSDTEVTVIYKRNEADHGVYATTRTIHYRYADGTIAAPDVVQTLNYKTTTDEQTGETVYTPNGIYAAQKSPVIAGYEADTAEVAMQIVSVSTTKPKNTEVTVIYTGDAVRHGIYKTTRTIHYRYADGTTAVPDVEQTLTYKTSTDLKTGKTVYTPQGFYLEQSTPLLTGYVADITQVDKEVKGATSTTPQNEAIIVTFSKIGNTTPGNPGSGTPTTTPGGNTPTVTPGNPGGNTSTTTTTPGNPGGNTSTTTTTTPGNPGGDTPTTTTTTPGNPDGETTTTTTTPGGDLPDTYGDDTPSKTTDTGIGTAVTSTPTAKVTTDKKTPVQQLEMTQGKRASALPQTGDGDGNKMSILGLALASFLGLFGLGVKKRREE